MIDDDTPEANRPAVLRMAAKMLGPTDQEIIAAVQGFGLANCRKAAAECAAKGCPSYVRCYLLRLPFLSGPVPVCSQRIIKAVDANKTP
jgi:hypothetical protein